MANCDNDKNVFLRAEAISVFNTLTVFVFEVGTQKVACESINECYKYNQTMKAFFIDL